MKLTEKEKLLLKDLKTAEQLCIDKYTEYSNKATDKKFTRLEAQREIERLTAEMREAARMLEFEKAAYIRDRIKELKSQNSK